MRNTSNAITLRDATCTSFSLSSTHLFFDSRPRSSSLGTFSLYSLELGRGTAPGVPQDLPLAPSGSLPTCTHRIQKLVFLRLFTDLFHKDISSSSEQISSCLLPIGKQVNSLTKAVCFIAVHTVEVAGPFEQHWLSNLGNLGS